MKRRAIIDTPGLEVELRKETRRPRELTSYSDMNILLGNAINQYSQAQRYKLYRGIKDKMRNGIDYTYIKAIIFPELFASDIPQPLQNLSYSRFSDRNFVLLNTGSTSTGASSSTTTGNGAWLYFPKTNNGPCFFYRPSTVAKQTVLPMSTTTADGAYISAEWQLGFFQDYSTYFTQTNLIAASISIQYVGQMEQESGFMTGAQIYGILPTELTNDDIEHGQFRTTATPSEGLRFIYLPMELSDYEFYTCTQDKAHNQGSQPSGEKTMSLDFSTSSKPDYKLIDGSATGASLSTNTKLQDFITRKKDISYEQNVQYIAGYWSGLPGVSSWLRVDIMRRFTGLPKTNYRDIVELTRSKKNFHAKRTFNVLRDLTLNAPIGGHTMKELDRAQDRLVSNVMNADGLLEMGQLSGLSTLEELASTLELNSAQDKGIVGDKGQTTRINQWGV